MKPSAPVELLHALAAVMEPNDWRWYVFGAQAVVAYGLPRMTADVDVTAALGETSPRTFVEKMTRGGFRLRVPDVDAFVAMTRVFPFVHEATGMPLDVVVAGPGLEELFLERAQRTLLGGVSVPVIAVEDLVVSKIIAGRPKDQEDVVGLLGARALEKNQIRELLAEVEAALGQSDLTPLFDSLVARAKRNSSIKK